MEVIIVKDYDAVSEKAFEVMKEVVTSKKLRFSALRQDPVRSDYTRT